jgi:hypothetical protein
LAPVNSPTASSDHRDGRNMRPRRIPKEFFDNVTVQQFKLFYSFHTGKRKGGVSKEWFREWVQKHDLLYDLYDWFDMKQGGSNIHSTRKK